jgi:hypothetical protein
MRGEEPDPYMAIGALIIVALLIVLAINALVRVF